jgi:hypothetical protein
LNLLFFVTFGIVMITYPTDSGGKSVAHCQVSLFKMDHVQTQKAGFSYVLAAGLEEVDDACQGGVDETPATRGADGERGSCAIMAGATLASAWRRLSLCHALTNG